MDFLKKISNIPAKLAACGLALVYACVVFFTRCPILRLTGLPCPGCGMTRALLAAIHLDFPRALAMHPMFWSVPVLLVCFWLDGKLFPRRWMNIAFYVLLGLGFGINWLWKL